MKKLLCFAISEPSGDEVLGRKAIAVGAEDQDEENCCEIDKEPDGEGLCQQTVAETGFFFVLGPIHQEEHRQSQQQQGAVRKPQADEAGAEGEQGGKAPPGGGSCDHGDHIPQGVGPEDDPAQGHKAEGEKPPEKHHRGAFRAEMQGPVGFLPVFFCQSAYQLEDPVEKAPQEKFHTAAVPHAADKKDDEEVAPLLCSALPVAAQGDIDIVPEPEAEGSVPPLPEFLNALGEVGLPEVFL